MNRTQLLAVAATLAAFAGTAFAQEPGKPDADKVRQIATTMCAACHGPDGNSAVPANPHLAGQHAQYITRQLRNFKQGVRKSDLMTPMAAPLSDADMAGLGAWFAQQKPKPGAARDADLVKLGQQIYRGGIAARGVPACAGCHSPNGAGIPANYPRLAGQFADYTFGQLKAFREERRGADREGKDPNGKVMAQIATKLTEHEMRAVAEYTSGLM